MDIVKQVLKVVQPQVAPSAKADSPESNLLSQLIALMGTKIASLESEPTADASSDGVHVIQQIFDQAEERGELITKLSEMNQVDQSRTQALIVSAAPLIMGQFSALSGNSSISGFLSDNLSTFKDKIPAWAISLFPAGMLGAVSQGSKAISESMGESSERLDGSKDQSSSKMTEIKDSATAVGQSAKAKLDSAAELTKKKAMAAGAAVEQAGSDLEDKVKESGNSKKWLAVLALAVLAVVVLLLWKSCQPINEQPATVAADSSTEQSLSLATLLLAVADKEPSLSSADSTQEPTVSSEGDFELAAVSGTVGSEALKSNLLSAISSFDAQVAPTAISVDPIYGDTLPAASQMPAILSLIKDYPGAIVKFSGSNVSIGGVNTAQSEVLLNSIKSLMPDAQTTYDSNLTMSVFDLSSLQGAADSAIQSTKEGMLSAAAEAEAGMLENQNNSDSPLFDVKSAAASAAGMLGGSVNAAADSTQSAVIDGAKNSMTALSSIDPANATASELAKALNLQVVNFATGKNQLPAENKKLLDKAAQILQQSTQINLEITGHTDARGSAQINKNLSLKRAQSVKDYLVSKGVSASRLKVQGVGAEEPIASNDTAEGRFKNRRIEFSGW